MAENIIKYGTGALNLENARIPYEQGEDEVGHNPHPKGRVSGNIIRTEAFNDGYDKFFLVAKVRQHKDAFNSHPTLKPVELMEHLVKLVTFDDQTVLDPFMGSGSTGVASLILKRKFIGYELDENYFEIAKKRLLPVEKIEVKAKSLKNNGRLISLFSENRLPWIPFSNATKSGRN